MQFEFGERISTVSQRIAVAGATGYIGGRLAPRLLAQGYGLRCLVRSREKLQNREWAANCNVEIRQSNLSDEEALTRGLQDCTAAYYLVHSMMSASGGYAQRDLELAFTFARAARSAGVSRIIYLGGLGEASRP